MSVVGKFNKMRKEQSFSIYPGTADQVEFKIQSGTRIGTVNKETGIVKMCPPVSSGAFFHHLSIAESTGKMVETQLTEEELAHFNEKMREYYENRKEKKSDKGIFLIG